MSCKIGRPRASHPDIRAMDVAYRHPLHRGEARIEDTAGLVEKRRSDATDSYKEHIESISWRPHDEEGDTHADSQHRPAVDDLRCQIAEITTQSGALQPGSRDAKETPGPIDDTKRQLAIINSTTKMCHAPVSGLFGRAQNWHTRCGWPFGRTGAFDAGWLAEGEPPPRKCSICFGRADD